MSQEANQVSDDSSQQTFSGQKKGIDDSMVLRGNEQASGQIEYQQQQQQPWNDLSYSSVILDSEVEEFDLDSTINEANRWN